MAQLRVVVAFIWEVTKRTYQALNFVLPRVLRFAKLVLTLMWGVFLTIWASLIPEVDNMTEAIKYNFVDDIPLPLQSYFCSVCQAVAFVIVLTGWVLLSYTTVWIVGNIIKLMWG